MVGEAADRVPKARRGQPLVAIVSLLVGYTVLRTAFWSPLLETVPATLPATLIATPVTEILAASAAPPVRVAPELPSRVRSQLAVSRNPLLARERPSSSRPVAASARSDSGRFGSPYIPNHHLLWLAAMTELPRLVREASAFADEPEPFESGARSAILPFARSASSDRLSGDAWIFARPGKTVSPLAAPGSANYGASQAGAVLRYALAPESRAQPELYGRIAAAIAGPRQQDLALGISARPHPDLPVRLQAEARATRQGERGQAETLLRPSIFATAGLFADHPGTGMITRGYAQAGFVGGKSATAFADGQIVTERRVARFDLGDVAVGAGAWGGVQRGAGRLDIGPSASIALRLAESPARLSADYRFRVAGDARPGSGAALTLSAGF